MINNPYTLPVKEVLTFLKQFKLSNKLISDAEDNSYKIYVYGEMIASLWKKFDVKLIKEMDGSDEKTFISISGNIDSLSNHKEEIEYLMSNFHFMPKLIKKDLVTPLRTLSIISDNLIKNNDERSIFNESGNFETKIKCTEGDLNLFFNQQKFDEKDFDNFITKVKQSIEYFKNCNLLLCEINSDFSSLIDDLSELKLSTNDNNYVIKKHKLFIDNTDKDFFKSEIKKPVIKKDEILIFSQDNKLKNKLQKTFDNIFNNSLSIDVVSKDKKIMKDICAIGFVITAAQKNIIKKEIKKDNSRDFV